MRSRLLSALRERRGATAWCGGSNTPEKRRFMKLIVSEKGHDEEQNRLDARRWLVAFDS